MRRSKTAIAKATSLVLLGAASSQLGFFYKTGSEFKWTDAQRYARDKDGLRILLNEVDAALAAGLLVVTVSWFVGESAYRATGALLAMTGMPILNSSIEIHSYSRYVRRLPQSDDPDCESSRDDSFHAAPRRPTFECRGGPRGASRRGSCWVWSVLAYSTLTAIYRPSSPYSMMAETLPVVILDSLRSAADGCGDTQATRDGNPWPFPDLVEESRWETPRERFRGWAPGSNSGGVWQYRQRRPPWLPEVSPSGFSKWPSKNSTQENAKEASGGDGRSCRGEQYDGRFYNPVGDPLKITNHDSEILSALKPAFTSGSVKIRHVVLIMLESYREELFPLQQGSDVHRMIARSHGRRDDDDEVNERLSHICPIAEKITGKSGRWKRRDGTNFGQVPTPEWNDTTQHGFGGINVVGGLTTASLSLKSMTAILCGVWPLPVDNFEESEAQSYQPCIPQILHLFNQLKENEPTDDFLEQQWLSAFFQSVTDRYDRQDKFDGKIGFDHIVTRKRLEQDAKESTILEKINYFGYPETTLRPHIRDYIEKSTGTTQADVPLPLHQHHPSPLGSAEGLPIYGTFDDYGIADETLFVFVGDHGQAFKEDVASKTGTYQNGHISNFRVPITFRHPRIPRVQYNALATSLSILPTILDLLVSTGSLNGKDAVVASDLIQDYEGQSFIRPYRDTHNGRRAWNFGIINSGASMLSVTSADAPWRLVMPLDQGSRYRLTDLKSDPLELEPLEKWSMGELASEAGSRHGVNASRWAVEAEAVARWWAAERKRLWGYKPG
ncbi:hypothetical protein MRS44_018167 [Fusarium solani]|uniref:uncharacterized protein n=1 Tax=Fusarium solani TaxID=169388 RepID=UPI0032C48A13|nr:hypothetical protein MRS44_018167 [Fusarium solani]